MEKIISVMDDKRKILEWFDVLEESFGIREEEVGLDKEEKSESSLSDQKDEERCFYCNKPLTNDQGIFDIFEHKRCVECNCEAIESEEEARIIADSCLYVLKHIGETVLWEKSLIKLRGIKFKKLVSIKVVKSNIRIFKKKEKVKNEKDKIKRKERGEAGKKGKMETGKRRTLGLVRICIKKSIPRLKLITEIFEWYFGRIQELEGRVVQQKTGQCLFEMGELSYAARYSAYFQGDGNESTENSESERNPLSDAESKSAGEISGEKETIGTELMDVSENKNNNIAK